MTQTSQNLSPTHDDTTGATQTDRHRPAGAGSA